MKRPFAAARLLPAFCRSFIALKWVTYHNARKLSIFYRGADIRREYRSALVVDGINQQRSKSSDDASKRGFFIERAG